MLIKGGQGVRGEGTTEANKQAAHDSRPPESERKENGGRPDYSRGFALKQTRSLFGLCHKKGSQIKAVDGLACGLPGLHHAMFFIIEDGGLQFWHFYAPPLIYFFRPKIHDIFDFTSYFVMQDVFL